MAKPKYGIVMTGGGARGAYQAGVVAAVSNICAEHNQHKDLPFDVIVGSSAGAINASFIASQANDFTQATATLRALWQDIGYEHVIDLSARKLFRFSSSLIKDFCLGNHNHSKLGAEHYLFHGGNLESFLQQYIDFKDIERNLNKGVISAVSIAATRYNQASTVHFVQGVETIKHWQRHHRYSKSAQLNIKHILASAAIPLFFSPQMIDGNYYGDGSIRNHYPISPAIHLGAEKILVVGVRNYTDEMNFVNNTKPSIARIGSVVLNAMFLDSVDTDLERLALNNIIYDSDCRLEYEGSGYSLRKIEALHIHPSRNISEIAIDYVSQLPKSIQRIVNAIGTMKEAASLLSYILFDSDYCSELIKLGYRDAFEQRETVKDFFADPNT